jgi:hypothetical protein
MDWSFWRRCACGEELFFGFDRDRRAHFMRHGEGEALSPPVAPFFEGGQTYSKDAKLLLPTPWVEWLERVHAYLSTLQAR